MPGAAVPEAVAGPGGTERLRRGSIEYSMEKQTVPTDLKQYEPFPRRGVLFAITVFIANDTVNLAIADQRVLQPCREYCHAVIPPTTR